VSTRPAGNPGRVDRTATTTTTETKGTAMRDTDGNTDGRADGAQVGGVRRYGATRALRDPVGVVDAAGRLVGQIGWCARTWRDGPGDPGDPLAGVNTQLGWCAREQADTGPDQPARQDGLSERGAGSRWEQWYRGWDTRFAPDPADAVARFGPGARPADPALDLAQLNDPPAGPARPDDADRLRRLALSGNPSRDEKAEGLAERGPGR